MAGADALLGGAFFVIILVMALPYILLLVALWRMGTGLKAIAYALSPRAGEPDLTEGTVRVSNSIANLQTPMTRIAEAIQAATPAPEPSKPRKATAKTISPELRAPEPTEAAVPTPPVPAQEPVQAEPEPAAWEGGPPQPRMASRTGSPWLRLLMVVLGMAIAGLAIAIVALLN